MPDSRITSIEELWEYLYLAMQLEHATIPPYLTALYSIHQGKNPDAYHILRVVVVEEMLHLTLAANILNAVGGKPDLTKDGFVPNYPTYLPDGETDFKVHLQRFSKAAIENFLKIERPARAPDESHRLLSRKRVGSTILGAHPSDEEMHFYSIGEFYEEICRGLSSLYEQYGPKLFSGDPKRQVTSEYYYSGGGRLIAVTDLETAQAAIDLIIAQGEGLDGDVYNDNGELAHFYRFDQLIEGRYYQPGDEPHQPTGPKLHTDWDAVYPIKKDAKLENYKTPELRGAAEAFNQAYANFLALINSAYNGQPERLLEAVHGMFEVRNKMTQLLNNPLPGSDGENAAPTFELAGVKAEGTA